MDLINYAPAFEDDRGSITDLLNDVAIQHIGLITSKGGMVRGNHYHEKAAQYNFVISGKIEVATKEPGGEVESTVAVAGTYFLTAPLCQHAMRFLEDSVLMVFTTEPRSDDGYERDTIRLDVPLIDS